MTEKEIKKLNFVERQNKLEKTFEYTHPGTYKEFIFMENNFDANNINNTNPGIKVPQKKVAVNLWSCCMNSDKNSRGCQKRAIRNFRWIYNP